MQPTAVRLTRSGLSRVLNATVGQIFLVDHFTPGVGGLVAHVRDFRYPQCERPTVRDFQIWSLGVGDWEPVR